MNKEKCNFMSKLVKLLSKWVALCIFSAFFFSGCSKEVSNVQLEQRVQYLESTNQELIQKNTNLAQLVNDKYMQRFDFSPQTYVRLASNFTGHSLLPNWVESNLRTNLATDLKENVLNQTDYQLSLSKFAWLLLLYHSVPLVLIILFLAIISWLFLAGGMKSINSKIRKRVNQLRRMNRLMHTSNELLQKLQLEKNNLLVQIQQLQIEKEKLGHLADIDIIEHKKQVMLECEEMLNHAKNQGYSMIKQAQRDARQIREQAEYDVVNEDVLK